MKQIRYFLYMALLVCSMPFALKAQETESLPLYNFVRLTTVANSYTVSAQSDTAFVREVFIQMADTIAFQGLQANLLHRTENGWQTLSSLDLQKPDVSLVPCSTTLCFYRRNLHEWVIYLGPYFLNERYRIELNFTGQSNYNWANEF